MICGLYCYRGRGTGSVVSSVVSPLQSQTMSGEVQGLSGSGRNRSLAESGCVLISRNRNRNTIIFPFIFRTVLVWDTRPSKSAAPTQAPGNNPLGTLPTFKHLDLTWKPVLKVMQCVIVVKCLLLVRG